ncbi:MAG TPA: 2-hydroxyacid dehydrogenase, partial [Burkholderiaceae bacterium]|nr:2-hydroxyacid dehydrogenase [Burkholderiaceae bacterium]
MKHKVLQYGRLMPALEKQLAEAFDWVRLVDQADPKAWLREHGREVVGLATAGFADAALIEALPSLKVISSFGVGVDKIDLDA